MLPLRIGIIGGGGITALLHLPEIAGNRNLDVVLIGGRKEDRLRQLCGKFDIPRWTRDYDDIIADDTVDTVSWRRRIPYMYPGASRLLRRANTC